MPLAPLMPALSTLQNVEPGVPINKVDKSPFIESDVSDLDCFHPSAQGQKTLSKETWDIGPFGAYQAGN